MPFPTKNVYSAVSGNPVAHFDPESFVGQPYIAHAQYSVREHVGSGRLPLVGFLELLCPNFIPFTAWKQRKSYRMMHSNL